MWASIMQLGGNLVMIYILAWLMIQTGSTNVSGGIKLALIVWAGFVACVTGPMYAFEAFPFYFFMINAATRWQACSSAGRCWASGGKVLIAAGKNEKASFVELCF